MADEANIWIIYMLSPLGAAFIAIFLWNLTQARFRIEREDHNRIKARIASLEAENNKLSIILTDNGIKKVDTEKGLNANGHYIRYPNGGQTCWGEIALCQNVQIDGMFHKALPASFSDNPTVSFLPEGLVQLISNERGILRIEVID